MKEAITFPPLPEETKLAVLRKQKPERKSFLRALILGKVDSETFTYPELASPRYEDYCKWINPIESYTSNCVNKKIDKKEILDNIRELEVFRTHINDKYFGITLSNTETLQLIEILSNLPWLGTYVLKNHIIPVEVINKYGSESQKLEYLPRIISGDIIPTICLYEDGYGTNVNSIKTIMMQQTTDSWVLNGEKEFVVNGINSNLFLVFAKCVAPTGKVKPDSFSLLLVERDFGNISCTNVCDTIGRHETPTCTIKFEDTVVPHKNIIGKPGGALDILMEYLKPGQQHITGQAISILRNFLNLIIPEIIQMKHFDRDLYAYDIVKKILGEITFSLYTMESMAYLTTGMIDQYKNMNADLEQIITETYCANKCLQCIQSGLQLVGSKSYMNNKSYIDALHNAMALTTMDINNLDSVTYIASSVLQLLGNNVTEFKDSILLLFEENGSAVMEQYSDMLRITFMLTEIYATFANITRASRSYSIGARNADLEKDLVTQMTYVSHTKVCLLKQEIDSTKAFNGDNCYISAMDLSYGCHKYPLAHPLTKTF
ncbi:Acyl-CoA dehydrogenase family member 9, mitochondrial [Melipona quadrifasciata]|uniref:Acyl-CoA dehydrogenase family member 9, mitochondrial n=1 Tax=Melipona quadrifasciata TaxID=166423 RepID=A0A0M8ZP38_9HYME|nr:Acyl-CoA dehydrogenase family member 9, mitochondrial [Melipona quadrifasciata]